MADPQQLLAEYIEAHRLDPAADPRPFLARAGDGGRAELQALIEGYLERAPRRAWDPDAFRGSLAERAVAAVEGELPAGWPAALPELRHRAELKRSTLVERLAAALGFPDSADRVASYYHRMEQGSLAPAAVSDRVLDALGSLLGTTAAALRGSGDAAEHAPPAGGEVFARGGRPTGTESAGEIVIADADAAPGDELDRLFTGGRG